MKARDVYMLPYNLVWNNFSSLREKYVYVDLKTGCHLIRLEYEVVFLLFTLTTNNVIFTMENLINFGVPPRLAYEVVFLFFTLTTNKVIFVRANLINFAETVCILLIHLDAGSSMSLVGAAKFFSGTNNFSERHWWKLGFAVSEGLNVLFAAGFAKIKIRHCTEL